MCELAKFRRQHPVGRYVLDFYCAAAKVAIEVDGVAHDMGDRPERDDVRDAWLTGQGVRVLRVPAGDVLRDVDGVAEGVLRVCLGMVKSPSVSLRLPPPHFHEVQMGRWRWRSQ